MLSPTESEAPVADLARLDNEWAKTPVPSEDRYGDIPDGSYEAVIEEAYLTETVSTGRPMVVWKLRIQGPQAVNRLVTKNAVITEKTLGFLKEELEKCRLQVSSLSELPARLGELVDHPIGLEKRTKDGRTNFYFRWGSARTGQNGQSDYPPSRPRPQAVAPQDLNHTISDDDVPF
jgi:hypothetical protein